MNDNNITVVSSLNDVKLEYSETCDIDHIYNVTIGEHIYQVSARYSDDSNEVDIFVLNDDNEHTLIGFAPVPFTDLLKIDLFIKSSVISYLAGEKTITIE